MLLMIGPIARLPSWTEQPNEGWNAIHAMHAFARTLYPAQPAWIINNYPPLWFYLTGALGSLIGDPIIAGRALALAAFFGTTGAVFALLRRLNASFAACLVGALSFVIIVAGLLGGYVGLSEPQMLAHALVTASVALALGATDRRTTALAAVGVVAGIFVKPIVIALPLAATLWLVLYRRHLVTTWIVTGGAVTIGGASTLLLGYGAPFAANFAFPRVLTLHRLGTNLALVLKAIVPLVAFAWFAARPGMARQPAIQFAAFAIGAALLEILMFGGALGVSINIVFDFVIGASVGAGLVYDRLADIAPGARWRAALVAAMMVRVAIGMPNPLRDISPAGRADLAAQQMSVEAVVDRLRSLPGPVACEALSACVWAGHASAADLWKMRFETTLASLNGRAFLAGVADGRFSAVVTFPDFISPAQDRNLPGLYAALAAWYEPPLKAGPGFLIFLRKPR
jgi:hypothetical protein